MPRERYAHETQLETQLETHGRRTRGRPRDARARRRAVIYLRADPPDLGHAVGVARMVDESCEAAVGACVNVEMTILIQSKEVDRRRVCVSRTPRRPLCSVDHLPHVLLHQGALGNVCAREKAVSAPRSHGNFGGGKLVALETLVGTILLTRTVTLDTHSHVDKALALLFPPSSAQRIWT